MPEKMFAFFNFFFFGEPLIILFSTSSDVCRTLQIMDTSLVYVLPACNGFLRFTSNATTRSQHSSLAVFLLGDISTSIDEAPTHNRAATAQ